MGIGFGLVSCQLTPGDPRGWSELYAEALELTEQAERLGFDSIWTTEHHFIDDGYMPSVLPMSAAMAARTNRIEIGTGVVLAPLYHPLRLAEDAATVDLISGGRLVLGLGLGWSEIEFTALGADRSQRGRAMEEMLQLLPTAFAGQAVDSVGPVYQLPGVRVRPVPGRPIPIVVGGGAEPAVRRAGRLADGFFSNASPEGFKRQVRWADEGLAERGHPPFRWIYYTYIYPCSDPDQGWDEIGHHVWASRWKYGDMEASATRAGPPPSPPPLDSENEAKLRKSVLLGRPDDLAQHISRLREEVGVDFEFVARAYYPGLSYERQLQVLEDLAGMRDQL
jgi:alkanesulfonate monooxygenase SsuD/methylene tetrahydromethanopterin reductase-like flavin-dependent oxidoreductase (luciferase family)